MSNHLHHEVEKLKDKILALTGVVKDAVQKAVRSVEELDPELAQKVIEGDKKIDRTEVEIEEECLKLLALYQPVATDLRFIVAVLKINHDIERIGDLAVNIAERTLYLSKFPPVLVPFNYSQMRTKALGMLSESLDALMRHDAHSAREVRGSDNEVDDINREMYAKISEAIRINPEQVELMLSYLSVSRQLERIADSATNIAEDVIYLIEGHIVRHKKPMYPETDD
ncbi:MAG: phosphate signaling complex protein PhoU [Candidatus Wallbacteria bacterium]|nr:phosphate signaling complex protein PhoU [Candidatus Wallbacteria bacterium]